MTILMTGITSEIGRYMCKQYLKDGNRIVGTYRSKPDSDMADEIEKMGGALFECDFSDKNSIDSAIKNIQETDFRFDVLISAVGIMTPIENFASASIDDWENNVYVNAISQIRFLRGVLSKRNTGASVFFLTSKGVNDAFPKHSCYGLSKIMLIKMCEFLDDEIDDCKFIAVNPGFIETKIIEQEGLSYSSKSNDKEGELSNVWHFIQWASRVSKETVSGRSFFAKYDEWKNEDFEKFLLSDDRTYKLRRFNDDWNNQSH